MIDYHIKRLGHHGDGVTEEGYLPPLPCPKNAFRQRQRKNRYNVKTLNPLNIVSNRPAPI